MSEQPRKPDRSAWYRSAAAPAVPDVDYDAWLAADLSEACAELDAGKGIPAEEVWKELGIE